LTGYKVFLSKTACKQLNSLDKKTAQRIKKSLRVLEENPFEKRSRADIKQLHGAEDPKLYRLRVGDYRAIYAVVNRDVKITEIIHRKKAYSFLD
jgi:mRNA interferase RelE/StbE